MAPSASRTRRAAARRACPLLHDCLYCVDRAWYGLRARCKRRRNSFKLYLFYSLSAAVQLLLFGVALGFYMIIWRNVRLISQDCSMDNVPRNESTLIELTLAGLEVVTCEGDQSSLSACELEELRAVLDAILANGVTGLLQSAMSFIMLLAFRLFTNLPAERLQYDKATRCTTCVGGICKHGPWLSKLLHVAQGCGLLVFWILMMCSYCKGELVKTYNCVNYIQGCGGTSRNCGYNQLRNCQYWYVHCQTTVDTDALQSCFSSDGRATFSGCIDIRLLTPNHCTRCAILKDDLERKTTNDFYLSDPRESEASTSSSCGASQQYNCVETAAVSGGRVCGCSDFQLSSCSPLVSTASTNTAARRLTSSAPSPPPQPCSWAPSAPEAFSMDPRHCAQPGSYVYRFSMLYIYLAAVCWVGLTLTGQAVRVLSKTEPWFFNPSAVREGLGWKLLRLAGP